MANVRLKNIQFPGLDNTYTIPDEAPAYSTSGTYAVGDMVIYDGKLYKCTTAITTAEAWTAAHWSETKMGNEVSELKTALTKEDLLNTHQIGIVDYHSLNYQQFGNWTSSTSTLAVQNDGSLKGTVNNGSTRSILVFLPNWGFPKTTKIAIRLRAKFSKSVQASLILRRTSSEWAWSTAVSFAANEEKEVSYVVTSASQVINGFSLQTSADTLVEGDTCIIYKCDIVNLDASPWSNSTEFRAACWNSDNRINDPYEILRMDNIPNSTFTYQNVGGVITITNELECLGFQGNTRTDVITDDGTDVTEVRTLATPPCSMTIVTNKTTKNGSVTVNGI